MRRKIWVIKTQECSIDLDEEPVFHDHEVLGKVIRVDMQKGIRAQKGGIKGIDFIDGYNCNKTIPAKAIIAINEFEKKEQ